MTLSSDISTTSTALSDIKDAIIAKGVTPSGNITTYATAISQISGGSSPVITSLNVTPTTSAQTITAPSGTDGYSPINVAAVTSSIDANITANNIVSGVTILGVTGNATVLNGTTLSVTPTTSAQTLTPTSPYNGFNEVNVSAVTSSIDANIVAGNIKKDVSILGVTGTYEGSGGESMADFFIRVYQGDLVNKNNYSTLGDTATLADLGGVWGITSISLPNVEMLTGPLSPRNTNLTSLSLPKLKFTHVNVIQGSSNYKDTTLVELNLPSLIYVSTSICTYMEALKKLKLESLVQSFTSLPLLSYCSVLEYVYIPSYRTFRDGAIIGTSTTTLKVLYLRDVTDIDKNFCQTTNSNFDTLVLAGNHIVNLSNSGYIASNYQPKFKDGTASIYVPDALVNSYKAATNWSTLASMIKPLSQFVNPYN